MVEHQDEKHIDCLRRGRARGNTAQLAEAFADGARAAGHHVETISLLKHEVKGCLGCNACRYGRPCVQKDDFAQMIPKIKEADLVVFACASVFLDHFLQAEGVYGTVLLSGGGGSRSAPGPL